MMEIRSNSANPLKVGIEPVWVENFDVVVSANKRDGHYWDDLINYADEADGEF